jgi:cytochrome c553
MSKAIATVLGLVAVSALAYTLVGIVIARSPYTHANLSSEGYDRTDIAVVGEEYPFEGLGLNDPGGLTGDPATDGRLLFLRYGCQLCHGAAGEGGIVGGDLGDVSPSEVRREVRDGPEGMPTYVTSVLSDEDLETIVAFLTSSTNSTTKPAEEEVAALRMKPRSSKGESAFEQFSSLLAAIQEAVAAE